MILKNKDQKNKMKSAAKLNNDCLLMLRDLVEPGISAYELEKKAEEFYAKNNAIPAFLNYKGFPYILNVMRNNEVVHCFPTEEKVFEQGDVVSIDTGCIYDGFVGDMAVSFGVGEISEEDQKLLNISRLSIETAVKKCLVGNTVGDISHAGQMTAEIAGFNVVKVFGGHGVGKNMHDEPFIPSFGEVGTGPKLVENQVLCIENQITAGSGEIYIDKKNGWEAFTVDGEKAATFEHQVIVGKDSVEVITRFD